MNIVNKLSNHNSKNLSNLGTPSQTDCGIPQFLELFVKSLVKNFKQARTRLQKKRSRVQPLSREGELWLKAHDLNLLTVIFSRFIYYTTYQTKNWEELEYGKKRRKDCNNWWRL